MRRRRPINLRITLRCRIDLFQYNRPDWFGYREV